MIRRLPPEVTNQIAAGEVVERPASVVKELVENALDAGARSVDVAIEEGGARLVRVVDDGDGFLPEDLPLAFASHATSKLATVADLDHIGSLGFRGEALASIGAVSRAAIRSRRADLGEGCEVRCDGGAETPPRPCGCPPGTQVEVRDLFFNVPARRRFLKAAAAERAKVQEIVAELAIARLDVSFSFVADGREVLRLPAGELLGERFARCFGAELREGLVAVERAFGDLRIEGLACEPDLARRDGRLELLYVNGRRAREASAVQAIRQAYREYVMGGRFPVYGLHVVLPPSAVDVNVHPRKAEVRFVEARRVAGCLHAAVAGALRGRGFAAPGATGVAVGDGLPRARSGFPELPADLFARAPSPFATPAAPSGGAVRESRSPEDAVPEARAAANPFARAHGRFLQVLDLYLLLECDGGLLVVDQHALHERVVYERLVRAHRARAVQVQRLLTPAVVEVLPADRAWLLAVADELAAEGLLVEEFSPSAVAVRGVPAVLGRVDPKGLLESLLHGAGDAAGGDVARPRVREQVTERFHSMACRAAVMRGDALREDEIEALLREAATLEHPHNCPHGRPTVLTFSATELERYFRRRC